MNGTQLKEYVSTLYEMETLVYQQEQLHKNLVSRKNSLISEPQKPKGRVMSAVIILIVAVILFICSGSWIIIILAVLGGIFFALPNLFFSMSADSDANKAYKKNLARYEKEGPERAELAVVCPQAAAKLEESKALLQQMYSIGIIYPKYQNLIAISSFYDYLMSGRCSELEGHEGAYNIYEMEARLDRIVTQLDVVIQKLDQIQRNQYMLYKAIQEGNKQNQELLSKLTSAVKGVSERLDAQGRSIAYAAYEAELTRKELQYQSSMNRIYGNWR